MLHSEDLILELEGRGLTNIEAKKFLALLQAMQFPKKLIREFHENCDEGFPGGPTVDEALIALKAEFDEEYFRPIEEPVHDWNDTSDPSTEELEDPELRKLTDDAKQHSALDLLSTEDLINYFATNHNVEGDKDGYVGTL